MNTWTESLDGPRLAAVIMLLISILTLASSIVAGMMVYVKLLMHGIYYFGPWRVNLTRAAADKDISRERRVLNVLLWIAFVSMIVALLGAFVIMPRVFVE